MATRRKGKDFRPPSPTFPNSAEREDSASHFGAAQIDVDSDSEIIAAAHEAVHAGKRLPAAEVERRQKRYQALITRQDEAGRRLLNNIFLFWVACEQPACKRNEACAGNPHDCFMRWWPWVPEGHKAHYRAYVHALAEGRTHEQAQQEAEAWVKRYADHIARIEAEQDAQFEALCAAERAQGADVATPQPAAAAEPAAKSAPPPPERPTPRVRML